MFKSKEKGQGLIELVLIGLLIWAIVAAVAAAATAVMPKPNLSAVDFGGGGVATVNTVSEDLEWHGIGYAVTVDGTNYSCYVQIQNKMTRRVSWSDHQNTPCSQVKLEEVLRNLNLGRMGDDFVQKISEILQRLLK